MYLSPVTAQYVEDRTDRMMTSIKKLIPNITEEVEVELEKMLDWHVGRTINDMKSQMEYVFTKKMPDNPQAKYLIRYFNLKLVNTLPKRGVPAVKDEISAVTGKE